MILTGKGPGSPRLRARAVVHAAPFPQSGLDFPLRARSISTGSLAHSSTTSVHACGAVAIAARLLSESSASRPLARFTMRGRTCAKPVCPEMTLAARRGGTLDYRMTRKTWSKEALHD
jgi:hypothetical protein